MTIARRIIDKAQPLSRNPDVAFLARRQCCYTSLTSVVAVTDCRLLVLEQAAFRRILEDYPVAKDRLLQMSLR